MSTTDLRGATKSSSISPRHGRVITPESRAVYLYEAGRLDFGQVNELEGGKFFPATQSGLRDPDAPDDVANGAPPRDGEIASGGRTADARAQLNEPDSVAHWQKHSVRSGQSLQISWSYSMPHKTRRWTYWITKPGWDASARLARAHFEPEPLKVYLNTYQPYWGPDADKELIPRGDTIHEFNLPTRTGYHVLLAVWDIADTANAFYQVIDLNFA
ncbi:lytic polysaccharide monooxygenase auxiliary activity family 9 protein [Burkholderia thailandensis]|uniref:Chitin binding protein, putative n=1 Tax=Burkholderia thailandensis (strain ATCC 700388 / DSM 13276 / CCUG 48851 / CIP 106301 / E264) TaxID=271848 RepID=Q2STN6_BURTA|nr:lytic polysaccharide monooxygenase auxiliary activity family 9 protein [Burkholderia thailandensis]ABC38514.1 chitin binding protein, putative [Burkholderia thailandensis E264]AHI74782.1 chitin binding domain protein [Burkholderia thailandensis 2002721723]AHI78338.1 chitin binding domain protein [Burkholderia thailandensis E444]AIC88716.1 chitin binding domain protein [Burkholderia thailandensis USAMRU Malaysia \